MTSRPFLSLAVLAVCLPPFLGTELRCQASPPDGAAADHSKPVQVFLLLGQSNMLGFGRVGPADQPGCLEHLVKEQGKYPHLVDADGN